MAKRERKTIDCVACGSRVPIHPRTLADELARHHAGEDYEASGMCDRCQTEIEEREAVVAARYERRGITLPHHALAAITGGL